MKSRSWHEGLASERSARTAAEHGARAQSWLRRRLKVAFALAAASVIIVGLGSLWESRVSAWQESIRATGTHGNGIIADVIIDTGKNPNRRVVIQVVDPCQIPVDD
jgi:hypothetical protein